MICTYFALELLKSNNNKDHLFKYRACHLPDTWRVVGKSPGLPGRRGGSKRGRLFTPSLDIRIPSAAREDIKCLFQPIPIQNFHLIYSVILIIFPTIFNLH